MPETAAAVASPGPSTPAPRRRAGVGFCLVMRLANPLRLGELLTELQTSHQTQIEEQLGRLGYVHYSRFVPIPDRGLLLIVTEYDGDQRHYVNDFAAVLDAEFSFLLSYMQDAPRLPVSRYPEEFYAYVERNTVPAADAPLAQRYPFSAYRDMPVMDLVPPDQFAMKPWPGVVPKPAPPKVDWHDVQANVVRGLRHVAGTYNVGIRFGSQAAAVAWTRAVSPRVTYEDAAAETPVLVNVGFTAAGLAALGLAPDALRRFPVAFRDGAWPRAIEFEHLAGGEANAAAELHALLTVSYRQEAVAEADAIRQAALAVDGCTAVTLPDGQRLGADGEPFKVHFGYVDNLTQPRLRTSGKPGDAASRYDTQIEVGDVLLGTAYRNSRNASPIGELDEALATNATYGAFQVIAQDVDAFERMLAAPAVAPPLEGDDPGEVIAAQLLGRWRDGRPLVDDASGRPVNDFDFWESPASPDADRYGRRCPFGAHIRRLNPRKGIVVGEPTGRSVIRRAMPYGGPRDADKGLVGYFFCSNLAEQFEFLQFAWADGDTAAPHLKGSVDPFIGRRLDDAPRPFAFTHHGTDHVLQVPRLTTLRAAAYLFLPGKNGLARLAAPPSTIRPEHDSPGRVGAPLSAIAAEVDGGFNATGPRFGQMPHRFYAHWRPRRVVRVGPPYRAWWVLSYEAVAEALRQPDLLTKPGKGRTPPQNSLFGVSNRLDDGLFFMAPDRHRAVRRGLQGDFDADPLRARALALAQAKADALLDAAAIRGVFDVVADFARPLTTHVFMQLALAAGDLVGAQRQQLLEGWVRAALAGHDENGSVDERLAAGSATFALRGYLHAMLQGPLPAGSLLAGLGAGGCPHLAAPLNDDEKTNTALHFLLGGFLSTEFLITTGTYNLLTNPAQWRALHADPATLLAPAIEEMLRFDAPFMMADRWLAQETVLGGVPIGPGPVTLVYGAANRDPEKYGSHAGAFDITRFASREPDHFGFGRGDYDCIGARLARWTAGVAFQSLVARFPAARIGEIGSWIPDPYYRSLKRLTLYTA